MKKKYIYPQACWEGMILEQILAQSSYDGTGADLSDPVVVSDDDFNGMF